MSETEFTLKLPSLQKLKKKKCVSFAAPDLDPAVFLLNGVKPASTIVEENEEKSRRESTISTMSTATVGSRASYSSTVDSKMNDFIENNAFCGVQKPALDKMAMLSWHRYVRSKEEIRVDLNKSLSRCKTFFGNVGIPFNYAIGDSDYKRRELRENWKERRATGIIGVGTEQDAFVIDNVVDTDDSQMMYMADTINENRKIAHRGNMTNMINEYKKRMVTRLSGLQDLENWILRLESENTPLDLDELDEMIEASFNEFTKGRYEAKSMMKQMRRLLRKMGEKHRMLQNRMKVTSKLKERAAAVNKSIKVDYTNMQTINSSFELLINRQLVFLSMNKKLSREAQENDEKLRKIQLYMTRCVKELSDDKEALFHKNHLLGNDCQKNTERIKLLEEEVEFYQNKEGLLKHQANVEAGKNIQALEMELELLTERYNKVCEEEDALKNEVQELHDEVLQFEVAHGRIVEELAEKTTSIERLELLLNDEKRKYSEISEEMTHLKEENISLRIANDTRPEVVHRAISTQSLESIPRSPDSNEDELRETEVVYVEKQVESYHVETDTTDLIEVMGLQQELEVQTDPIEFAEDKKRGLTDPFTTDLMAGNLNFLQTVGTRRDSVDQGCQAPRPQNKMRVVDTPGYTQMIVKRLKEERENDIARLSDYIKREKQRTEATSRKLGQEHKRAMRALRREIKAVVLSIIRHRDKLVNLFHKNGVSLEGLVHPTVAEFKSSQDDKTTVSLKHTALEIINAMDYNTMVGLKEIQMKVKETLANQKLTERELALKNRRLEKSSKTVETFDSRMLQLKRDMDRLRMREQYTNERYRELLKREEELERAEEAHVTRIEERLSEMWCKSTTDIEGGLDEILQVKKKKPLAESQLRRLSRPHRPQDRLMHTLTNFDTEPSIISSVKSLETMDADPGEETSSEDEIEEEAEREEEEEGPIQINNIKSDDTEELAAQEPKGLLHKGQAIASNQVTKCASEWSETKTEEVKQYIEDMQTIKPATITHPGGEGKFLHFDSSVAKIDDMYTAILHGKPGRRKRRDANICNMNDTTVLHYNNRPVAEMQLTILAADQRWNIHVLRNAYENKAIGIRIYSNALDLIRRNLSLRDTRFSLVAKRLLRAKTIEDVRDLLIANEGNEIDSDVVMEVMDRLPQLQSKDSERYFEKVRKLLRLNTYILAEQVRVFQQVRDGDLAMNLRFPYPILEDSTNPISFSELRTKPTKPSKGVPFKKSNLVKVEYPGPMESVLTASSMLTPTQPSSNSSRLWRNPTFGGVDQPSATEPLPHMLVLDCNALKPHTDTTLPMGPRATKVNFNPHKTIPPIPKSLEEKSDNCASFTLPVVHNYSSTDSGYEGSTNVLDPARYM